MKTPAMPRWTVKTSVYPSVSALVGTAYTSAEEAIKAVADLTPRYAGCATTAVRYGDDTTICIFASEASARSTAARWGATGGGDTMIVREGIRATQPVPGKPSRTGHRIEFV